MITAVTKEAEGKRWRLTANRAGAAVWAVVGITALAAALRFFNLGHESLWFDEALSAVVARQSWDIFWSVISSYEANMFLYYIALRGWLVFGMGEGAVRSLSAFAGLLAVPVLFAAGRRLMGVKAALIAAFLLAVNQFAIHYAQEARSYSLLVLLVLLSCLFLIRALEDTGKWNYAGYVVATIFAVYCHVFALLLIPAQVAVLAAALPKPHLRRPLVACWLIVMALSSPLLWCMVHYDVGQLNWVRPVNASSLTWLFATFAGSRPMTLVCAVSVAVALATIVRGWRRRAEDAAIRNLMLVTSWLLTPILIAFLASFWHPLFMERYLILCLPAQLLLAGWWIAKLKARWAIAVILMMILLSTARNLRTYYGTPTKENWRDAASLVVARSAPGDALVFSIGAGRLPFSYYAALDGRPDLVSDKVDMKQEAAGEAPMPERATINRLASEHRRIWMVESHLISERRLEENRNLEAILAQHHATVSRHSYRGVDVVLYAPGPGQ